MDVTPEIAETVESAELRDTRVTGWSAVIVFRLLAGIYWVWPLASYLLLLWRPPKAWMHNGQRFMWPVLLPNEAFLGALGCFSIVIGLLLLLRQRWVGWLILLTSATIVAWRFGFGTPQILRNHYPWEWYWFPAIVALAAEGLYVARRLGKLYVAAAFALVFSVVFAAGARTWVVQRNQTLAKIAPVVKYVDAHWIRLPKGVMDWDVELERRRGGWTSITLSQPGYWHSSDDSVWICVQDLGNGRWRFAGGGKAGFGWQGLSVRSPDSRAYRDEMEKDHGELTADDAIRWVRKVGVPYSDLRLEKGVHGEYLSWDYWAFKSSKANLLYTVTTGLDSIDVQVAEDVYIPQRETGQDQKGVRSWK